MNRSRKELSADYEGYTDKPKNEQEKYEPVFNSFSGVGRLA